MMFLKRVLFILFLGLATFHLTDSELAGARELAVDEFHQAYIDVALQVEGGAYENPFFDGRLKKLSSQTVPYLMVLPGRSISRNPEELQWIVAAVEEVGELLNTRATVPPFRTMNFNELFERLKAQAHNRDNVDVTQDVQIQVGDREQVRVWVEQNKVRLSPRHLKIILDRFDDSIARTNLACNGLSILDETRTYIKQIAIYIVYEGDRDYFKSCLFEEIMQSVGLLNDLPPGSFSIFNDDSVYLRPTLLDWKLWRIHTDPAMKAGMGKKLVVDTLKSNFMTIGHE